MQKFQAKTVCFLPLSPSSPILWRFVCGSDVFWPFWVGWVFLVCFPLKRGEVSPVSLGYRSGIILVSYVNSSSLVEPVVRVYLVLESLIL